MCSIKKSMVFYHFHWNNMHAKWLLYVHRITIIIHAYRKEREKKVASNESLDFDLDEVFVSSYSRCVCLCLCSLCIYFGGILVVSMDKYLHFTLKDKYFRPTNLTSHQFLYRHTHTYIGTCTTERPPVRTPRSLTNSKSML